MPKSYNLNPKSYQFKDKGFNGRYNNVWGKKYVILTQDPRFKCPLPFQPFSHHLTSSAPHPHNTSPTQYIEFILRGRKLKIAPHSLIFFCARKRVLTPLNTCCRIFIHCEVSSVFSFHIESVLQQFPTSNCFSLGFRALQARESDYDFKPDSVGHSLYGLSVCTAKQQKREKKLSSF